MKEITDVPSVHTKGKMERRPTLRKPHIWNILEGIKKRTRRSMFRILLYWRIDRLERLDKACCLLSPG